MPDQFHIHLYGPDRGPLPTSFEEAAERLERLDKLYFEPDGSFVWNRDAGRQQIFGMLYDAAGTLQYVDLRGTASRQTFQSVVDSLLPGVVLADATKCTVVRLADGSMQDLQSFANLTWGGIENKVQD